MGSSDSIGEAGGTVYLPSWPVGPEVSDDAGETSASPAGSITTMVFLDRHKTMGTCRAMALAGNTHRFDRVFALPV